MRCRKGFSQTLDTLLHVSDLNERDSAESLQLHSKWNDCG